MRDTYFRYKRKNKVPTGSAANAKGSKWVLFCRLSFLEKVARERTSTTNIDEQDDTETIDDLDEVAERTNTQYPGTKFLENEEHASTTPTANKHSKDSFSKATPTSVDSTDKASLQTTRVERCSTRKKRKSNSAHDEFLDILKKREQQRQESFKTICQQTSNSNDGTINSFCDYIKSVLQTLPPALAVQAKSDIYNIISKYELEAVKSNVQFNTYSSPPSTTNSFPSPYHRNESSLSGYTVASTPEDCSPCSIPVDNTLSLQTYNYPQGFEQPETDFHSALAL